jgi:hypothetical protein
MRLPKPNISLPDEERQLFRIAVAENIIIGLIAIILAILIFK